MSNAAFSACSIFRATESAKIDILSSNLAIFSRAMSYNSACKSNALFSFSSVSISRISRSVFFCKMSAKVGRAADGLGILDECCLGLAFVFAADDEVDK